MTYRQILLFTCVLGFTALQTALGQSTAGTITGNVVDPTGASVVGARIDVRSEATGAVITTQTTATGDYTAPSLRPGPYSVSVTASGFKVGSVTRVQVISTQITTQNFALAIGQTSETLQVTAAAPLINPNSAAVTTTVGNKMLQEIPFTDNSTLSAVLLTPGAQGDPQYSGGVQSELPGIFTQAVAPGGSITVGGGIPGAWAPVVVPGRTPCVPPVGAWPVSAELRSSESTAIRGTGIRLISTSAVRRTQGFGR